MLISALELFHVAVQPPQHASHAAAETIAPREAVLVRIVGRNEFTAHGSQEFEGWGEATVESAPLASDEWAGGVFALAKRHLAPLVLGAQITSPAEFTTAAAPLRGHGAAKCAIDVALHDLAARAAGEPLWKSLGATECHIQSCPAIGQFATIDELIAELETLTAAGQSEFTLQLRPGWGIEVVRAVRETFPTVKLRVDFNGTATLEQRDLLFRLQDYMIEAIEQPLDADDLVGHAMLQEALRTNIALDQSIRSPWRVQQAVDLGACREVRLRAEHVGGLTPALQVAAICAEQNMSVLVGSGAATVIGLRQAIALAAAIGPESMVELEPFALTCGNRNPGYDGIDSIDAASVLDGLTILATDRFEQ